MPPPALRRKVYVVGGHITKFIGAKHPDFIWKKHPEFGKKENPILEDYIYEAVNETLKATDTPAELVDKAWIGNFAGELFFVSGSSWGCCCWFKRWVVQQANNES
mmetsp:Transcript_16693/g.19424  ORF Transcript_16693/g.19424 Transcript_16693/m.19424 type:complete len:105 (+) Transcript_16693:167-481(+)